MKTLSVIVPCYNEQEALPIFYTEITQVLSRCEITYELILVDDGSSDNTLPELRALSEKDSRVVYLSFSRNFGKEAAMFAGFCNASGDYIAIMDADLQDPPALLPEMLKILESEDYDSVATRRVSRKGEPPVRSWFAKKFYQLINRISDVDIVDGARDFRLMKKSMVEAIVAMNEYANDTKVEINLYQGLPKGDKMDLIVQKCTELGISSITPVEMPRSIAKIGADKAEKKTARWQKPEKRF